MLSDRGDDVVEETHGVAGAGREPLAVEPGALVFGFVEGETLNISPYNHDYDRNVFSLPPEPRGVANAVIGY